MGSKDPDFSNPAQEARFIADAVGGTLVMVDGAGHYPHAEFPEVTAPLVVGFLSR
jgi:pimeloyl-ACP methyl ester carboxylesterase